MLPLAGGSSWPAGSRRRGRPDSEGGSQMALVSCDRCVLLRAVAQHATAARTVGTDSALIASIRAEWRECRGWGGPGPALRKLRRRDPRARRAVADARWRHATRTANGPPKTQPGSTWITAVGSGAETLVPIRRRVGGGKAAGWEGVSLCFSLFLFKLSTLR